MTGMVKRDRSKVVWRSLVRKSEFQKVYEQGVKLVGRLVVVYLMAPGEPRSDLARAVVASRKIGGAVARNRAKRVLREAHRLGPLGDPDGIRRIRKRFLREPNGTGETVAVTGPADMAGRTNTDAGLWVILIARRQILGASSREVREELDTLLVDGPRPHEPVLNVHN